MPYRFLYAALLFLAVLFLISCSTKKNTFTRRVYHNLTSHYNVYWNGKQALLEAEVELEKLADDQYNKVLPVFNYGSEADANSLAPLLDRAIEKGSKTILRHSMEFGGKEYVKWIDDAYMLIGKSYFYKQDYYSARRSFNFVMRNFDKNLIRYDAMLWLAKTYNQLKEFERAEPLLNLVRKDASEGEIPGSVMRELPLVYADYFILQEKYDDAIEYIYEGLGFDPPKDMKTRLKFILAQIYQKNGDFGESSELYAQVIRRNPEYEMAFQAKINLAMTYESGMGNSDDIIKILNRMLKDEKNKEYHDQIYFALADIALKDNNDTLGIYYLKLSVKSSISNNYQKATSALRLADLYFNIPKYEPSQAYYDTAMQFLPKDYPDYELLQRKTGKLSDLVNNLQTIQLQDSLQTLAAMPEDELIAAIDKIIEEVREQERIKREQEQLAAENAQFLGPGMSGFGSTGTEGKWYFYNPSALSQGFTEFQQKWGRRQLEDLWRLRDKQIIAFEPEEIAQVSVDTTAGNDSTILLASDPHNREYYLKDIPFTEEQKQESNDKIILAYYNLGLIYREGLDNSGKSIEAYEELIRRFPGNEYELKAYYQLYRLFLDEGNQERSDYYKSLILNGYPDSDYAKIIEDPDYYRQMQEQENQLSALYADTYDAYISGSYFSVIENADLAMTQFGDSASLIPKFAYLKALSIGHIDIVDSLVVALNRIIQDYPGSEVEPLAQNILDYVIKDRPDLDDGKSGQEQDSLDVFPYEFDENATHLYMLVVKKQAVKLNPIKVKLSDFNQKYFRLIELTINSVLLDKNQYLITVGNFDDARKAINYYNAIFNNRYVFSDLSPGNYEQFLISSENYPLFYKDKDISLYARFFAKYYKVDKK
ncbi:MAG: tetratricopeptide repeat protein [Bacteroidetes bacterium]|nr:tetratricopeptide repeat protein [Bacteroidota bacterium]